jgi:hypothetical protein
MSEYLKRKVVINKVNEIPAHFNSGDIRYGIEIAIQAIKDTPTADVAEVVRCKDCKHYVAQYCTRDIKSRTNMFYMCADDFCSYGERKDEE